MAVRKRVRGVIASRNKLEIAMLNAGIRSQSELAQQIAEKESLNSPPKDLVNRTFRQKRVSHQTITRIASVLGISPHSLFLTQEELAREEEFNPAISISEVTQAGALEPNNETSENNFVTSESHVDESTNSTNLNPGIASDAPLSQRSSGKINYAYTIAFLTISIAIFASVKFFDNEYNPGSEKVSPLLAVHSLMVIKGDNALAKAVATSLMSKLNKDFSVSSASISDIAATESPYSLSESYDVDLVISLELLEKGIFKGLLAYAYTSSSKTLLTSILDSEAILTKKKVSESATKIERALEQYLSTPNYIYQGLKEREAKNYISSQVLLHKGLNEENVNAALEKVYLVLATAPANPLALAQLCNLYAQKMYLTADRNYLSHANNACEKASKVAGDKSEVLFSLAQKNRREDEIDKSISYYKEALKRSPNYSAAYIGLTESYLKQFLVSKSTEAIAMAKESISKAGELAPNDWMIPFIEARLHYYEGNTQLALKKFEESKEIEVTQNVLGNLGSIYFCNGQIEAAFQNYKTMEREFGASNISNHLLATASFYMQDFEEAIYYNLESLDAMAESNSDGLYPIWINLGDSYLASNLEEKARDAYQQAAKISERSNQSTTLKVDQLYVYLQISRINNSFETSSVKMGIREELTKIDNQISDPGAKFRAMVIWAFLGEKERARSIQEILTAQCRGLAQYPGVESILN